MGIYKQTVEEIVNNIFSSYLPSFWKKTEFSNNYQIIKSFSSPIRDLTEETDKLYTQLSINTATGSFLDDIGLLFRLSRNTDESDTQYRSRLKAYYQIFLNSGTSIGIKKAISLMLGINQDDIHVNDIVKFIPQQFLANMESSEPWLMLPGVSADSTYYFQGSRSIRLTKSGGSGYIITALIRAVDLEYNIPVADDVFRLWCYLDDVSKIDSIILSFVDNLTVQANNTITIDDTYSHYNFLYFNKKDFTNTTTIDWNNIKKIYIRVLFNAASFASFDWLQFGVMQPSMQFEVIIDINDTIGDLSLFNGINEVVTSAKAAGTYYKDFKINSKDDLFLINSSKINNKDKI